MSATERLDQIEALAQAATDETWTVTFQPDVMQHEVWSLDDQSYLAMVANVEDAEFIAAARQVVPALAAALRAVLDVTNPRAGKVWSSTLPDAEAGVIRVADVLAAVDTALADC